MKVAVIGAGNVGRALSASLLRAGHEVVIAAEHVERAESVAGELHASHGASPADATREAEVIVIAVPFAAAAKSVAEEIRPVADGKIVVDATNPLGADMTLVTEGTSAAEEFQRWLPTASVVKAFNTLFASRQADPSADGIELDGFVAGDDAAAKATVMELVGSLGLRSIDAGDLTMARVLEGMALLNMKLQIANGWSWRSAWKLVD